jgi:rhodanese-related sulfurtransferase
MSETDRRWAYMTTEQLLSEARERLERVAPERAQAAMRAGALLIDIRSEVQRERDGVIPGSRFIARNVLEWRCDPASPWHDPVVTDGHARLIVICNEGYQSSLAAATLHRLGLVDATDVIGGFQAWNAAGLPVRRSRPRAIARRSAIRAGCAQGRTSNARSNRASISRPIIEAVN